MQLGRLRLKPGLLGFLVLMPAGMALWFVLARGLPIPVGDQWWDTTYLVIKARTNDLRIEDYLMFYEGHRPALIRMLAVASAYFSGHCLFVLNLTTWFVAVFSLCLLWILFSPAGLPGVHLTPNVRSLAMLLFSLILFTLYHQQGWIDYYFSTYSLSFLFLLVSAVVILRSSGGWFSLLLLICLAILSCLSLGLGLGVWVATPIMALGFSKYRKPEYLLLWALSGCLFLFWYAHPLLIQKSLSTLEVWPLPASSGTVQSLRKDIVYLPIKMLVAMTRFVSFFLSRRFLGTTGLWDKVSIMLSLAAFGLLVCNLVKLLRANHSEVSSLWGGLASFSLIGSILIYASRGDLLPAERHSPCSDGFWLALVATTLVVGIDKVGTSPSAARFPVTGVFPWLILSFVSVASVVKNVVVLLAPPTFPKSCISCARDYAFSRDQCLRSCFRYADEQSLYQMTLLDLAGLNSENPPFRVTSLGPAKVVVMMPDRFTAEIVMRSVFQSSLKNWLSSYSPAREQWQKPHAAGSFYEDNRALPKQSLAKSQYFTNLEPLVRHVSLSRLGDRPMIVLSADEVEAEAGTLSRELQRIGWRIRSSDTYRLSPTSRGFHLTCFSAARSDSGSNVGDKCAGVQLKAFRGIRGSN